MSFWAFLGILLIVSVMFGALYMSKAAMIKEQAELEKRKKIRQMRTELMDIDELINSLFIYDRNPELLSALNERLIRHIHNGLTLLPNSEDLLRDLSEAEAQRNKIKQLTDTSMEPEIPNSDRQIFLMKKSFSHAIRQLKCLQNEGDMTEAEGSSHKQRLVQNALLLEAKAYRNQATEAKRQKDISSAANFLKHAKELLVNSDKTFDAKTTQIKEISRDISQLYVTLPEEKQQDEEV